MFGKCWSIQYVNHEAFKLCDKIHTQPMYFTAKAAMKAIRDWIDEMCAYGTTIDHITEEFLAKQIL